MGKYQEAFDLIKGIGAWSEDLGDFYDVFDKNDPNIKLLQELVDKATPYRPKKLNISYKVVEFDYRRCKCGLLLNGGMSYCPYCGQALDWSD